MGYISNIKHFLSEDGNIPVSITPEARDLANFLALIIDSATCAFPVKIFKTGIRCNEPGCKGSVITYLSNAHTGIDWNCTDCENWGTISDWQGTKWDNTISFRFFNNYN